MLQFGASLTDDTRSINYDRNTVIIQATGLWELSLYSLFWGELELFFRRWKTSKNNRSFTKSSRAARPKSLTSTMFDLASFVEFFEAGISQNGRSLVKVWRVRAESYLGTRKKKMKSCWVVCDASILGTIYILVKMHRISATICVIYAESFCKIGRWVDVHKTS